MLEWFGFAPEKYPALGFDPAPGTPANVAAFATVLKNAAGRLQEARGEIDAVARGVGGWEGQAAEGFRNRIHGFPKKLDEAASTMTKAADLLEEWHQDLVTLQTKARAYEQDAAAAKKKVEAAEDDPALSLVGQFFDNDLDLAAAQAKVNAANRRLETAQGERDDIVASAETLKRHHEELSTEVAKRLGRLAESASDPGLLTELLDGLTAPFDAFGDWMTNNANRIANLGDVFGDIAVGSGLVSLLIIGTGTVLSGTVIGAPLGGALIIFGGSGLGASTILGIGSGILHGSARLSGGDVSGQDLVFDLAGASTIPIGKVMDPALEGLDDVTRGMREAFFDGSWQSSANSMQQEDIANHVDDYWQDGWYDIPAAMERAWSLGGGEDDAAQREKAERLQEAKKAVAH
ncbi:WXG100 family type VII secretion target [Micromonospora sp. NPDC023814]|uniref:WXG100 family type VII secretion target n=1 Tax=Micromonospora sp. NPDC023814 TaxID=3154596 RepID=UPI0033E05F43